MFTLTMIVVLVFVLGAGIVRFRYARQCSICNFYFNTSSLIKYLPFSPDVREQYREKAAAEVKLNTIWIALWMLALGDVLFLWMALPETKIELPSTFVFVASAVIAAVIAHAITLSDKWVKMCLQAFHYASQTAIEVELAKLEADLPALAQELGVSLEELKADAEKLKQIMAEVVAERIKREM
jgi:hypothetical protein